MIFFVLDGREPFRGKQGKVTEADQPPILVVDDDTATLTVAASFLRHAGYAVLIAQSGEEALEIVRAGHDVSLLLTDVIMPGMSGPELADEVLRIRKDARILLMSGGTPDQLEQYWALGSGYPLLPKPVQSASLVAAVRRALA